ncbi:MAG: bifunctional D-glycero-beta-D-manno-heptose-7-phosphate kinase/D-glycero-beta-D-manno-heptose 1-phosphate adenylyltransferase HldE [Candidatus Schekmanbacteria bacterium]|nr:MAG: bifunctional D-glycero-beta-D-manno-heptose-7-phosphate kinase/D-glycero-beta-D-manno-heptose 1-phosphate adenylyltransferase HldE [Candidatus Schekmanbacteria bacterium]
MNIQLIKEKFFARRKPRILVIGDLMLDEYIWGTVDRISPEAPVQVVKIKKKENAPGGAANVVNNLASLGAKVTVAGIIGKDSNGSKLLSLLRKKGAKCSPLISSKDIKTITKTRIIAHNQQVVRIDDEPEENINAFHRQKMFLLVKKEIENSDGLIISDYNKGTVDEETIQKIIKFASACGKRVIVDPKGKDYSKYRGCYVVTPNLKELEEATNIRCDSEKNITDALSKLQRKLRSEAVLVTRGSDGMTLLLKGNKKFNFKSCALEVFDVSGAGDTVVAAFAYSLFSGLPPEDSAMISNIAGGIVVEKVGTSVATKNEILSRIDGDYGEERIIDVDEIEGIISKLRRKGKKIVFTNGCFDILHMGHIYLLQKAKAFGDILIVAINTDSSIKRIKGENRPLISEGERAKILSALSCVDYVTFFDDDTPMNIIKKIKPDVLVKGGDYSKNEVVGAEFVEKNGGRVELVKVVKGLSTTNIIKKILSQYGNNAS